MLDQELKAYQVIKARIPVGQFVLIHGEDLVGVFETEAEAFSEGARQFGRGPFLIRQVRAKEETIANPALSLGILRAPSTSPASR
jgi:hypothetical protein